MTITSELASINDVDDAVWSLDGLRRAARRVAELMRESEAELAISLEQNLFPDGVPERVSAAAVLRAQAEILARDAQLMIEADIAYTQLMRKHQPGYQPESTISHRVAMKLAQSAEIETTLIEDADRIGADVERCLFPDGVPKALTMLGFLQALRLRLEQTLERTRTGDEATAAMRVLGRELPAIAQLYGGLCELAGNAKLTGELLRAAGLR